MSGAGAARVEPVNPEELGAPRGYSHGVLAPVGSRLLFVAGQVGWDGEQRLVSPDFAAQFERALANVLAVVRAAGGRGEDLVRMTIYVTARSRYTESLAALGEIWRRHLGRHYPAMTLIEVAALLEPGALVELEATAAIPAPEPGAAPR